MKNTRSTKNVIILMTALLPTTGHADLIRFAESLDNVKVHVLINGRTFEPLDVEIRAESFRELFPKTNIVTSVRNDAPQNPDDVEIEQDFWNWWKDEINNNFPEVNEQWDYVVASESYGQQVADSLNADFLPYDIERFRNNSKSTEVRKDLWNQWNKVLPLVRREFMVKTVMFGQESVGKTTLANKVAESLNVNWELEYARPYLEEVGEELSLKKMKNIHAGQSAVQKILFNKAKYPAAILDTDLFSTIGYYRIMNEKVPESLVNDALTYASNVYYILPDNIPLVQDPLRYGGDVRESTTMFWVNLLEEFNQNFVMVPEGSVEQKMNWIVDDIRERFEKNVELLKNFQRD